MTAQGNARSACGNNGLERAVQAALSAYADGSGDQEELWYAMRALEQALDMDLVGD